MYTNILASLPSSAVDPDVVEDLAKTTANYGFMTVFSIIVLILISTFFILWFKSLSKEKAKAEERNDSIYNVVVNIQTQQIVQLQNIADQLQNINNRSMENRDKLSDINMTMNHLDDSLKEMNQKDDTILMTLSEIVSYVKANESTNKEILDKVNTLDEYIRKLVLEKNA